MAAKFQLDKFDGPGDFVLWRVKMKALLTQQNVVKALKDHETLLQTMTEEQVQEMDEIASTMIVSHLADNVLRQIGDGTSALGLLNRLEQLFLTRSFQEKFHLKGRFFRYRMDPSKNLEENLEEFSKIAFDLSSIGEKMSDENQAVILLNSVSNEFNEVKETFIHDKDSLTLSMVLDALRAKDLEMKEKRKCDTMFLQERFWKNKESGKKCYHCQKVHFRRNCPKLKDKENPPKEWILSSGCTFHMTPNKDYIFKLKRAKETVVRMGNDDECEVDGIGSVKIKTHDGQIRILTNVRYVPNLKSNLISLGALDQNGCTYNSEQGILKVYKGSSLKLKGRLTNGVYKLEGSAITGTSSSK